MARDETQGAAGRPVLRRGDRGAFVIDLQYQLQGISYWSGQMDGIFGDLTRASVLAFQADHGLDADGVVGPSTWQALASASPRPERAVSASSLRAAGSRTIRRADQAQILTTVMAALGGGAITVENIEEALALWQEAQGLAERVTALTGVGWPVIAVVALGAIVWSRLGAIKRARLEDARASRNLGR